MFCNLKIYIGDSVHWIFDSVKVYHGGHELYVSLCTVLKSKKLVSLVISRTHIHTTLMTSFQICRTYEMILNKALFLYTSHYTNFVSNTSRKIDLSFDPHPLLNTSQTISKKIFRLNLEICSRKFGYL